jgi:hypothetical protein
LWNLNTKEKEMIEITDVASVTPSYWEVVDTTNVLPTVKLNYDSSDKTGYDRVRVLRQIVDYYAMSGHTQTAWKTPGSVFTIQ